MSKFNQTNSMKTTNQEGFPAYKMQDKERLVTSVMTTFFGEPKFYGDNTHEIVKLAAHMANHDPAFVANLAASARKDFHLRSVFHALVAILAHEVPSKPYVREVCKFIERPDEMMEILACYISMYGKPIPNSLKKGLSDAFGRFNEYQLAKYNGGNREVKLRDILRICHIRPLSSEKELLYKKVLDDTMEVPYTWEVELSSRGNTKEVWEELIDSGKVGYMALLRNLNNIVESDAKNLDKVLAFLSDRLQVYRSKQLPFRFYSAYKKLKSSGNLSAECFSALETALTHSIDNIEKIPGRTLIGIDVSWSMSDRTISKRSKVLCSDISCLLGAMASKLCEEAEVVSFDSRPYPTIMRSGLGIIANAENIDCNGGGTRITLVPEYALNRMLSHFEHFDRIIILSDNEANSQCSQGSCQALFQELKRLNPNIWIHAIDLQGYGTQQFIGEQVNVIAGWSEHVFEFINMAERGFGSLTKSIDDLYIKRKYL